MIFVAVYFKANFILPIFVAIEILIFNGSLFAVTIKYFN
jgi:ribosomal protein S19